MEYLHNPLVIGAISSIVVVLIYLIDIKVNNNELENNKVIKVLLLGFFVGVFNSFLYTFSAETNFKVDQDILTGTPDF